MNYLIYLDSTQEEHELQEGIIPLHSNSCRTSKLTDRKLMKRPRASSIEWFLQERGWRRVRSDKQYFTLKPPPELKFENDFMYRIPVNEEAPDYREYAIRQVFSIAELYNRDRFQLLDLLSKSVDKIKKNAKLRALMLPNAS